MGLFPPLRPRFGAALRDVHSRDPRARAAAAESLGSPPPGREQEAKEALRPLLDDPIASVRAAAIASAGGLKDEGALDELIGRFEDGDPTVRQIALIAAAEVGDRRALPALREALRRPQPDVRFQAVASLVTLAGQEAVSDLEPLVEDPDAEVRAHLADALASLQSARTAEPLARLLQDEARGVRHAAAIGLAGLADARGVDALIDALRDPDRCFEAAWALGELQASEAREPLARLAFSFFEPLLFRAAAAAALVRVGEPQGARALRKVLLALRSDGRSFAAQLAGELELVELAKDVASLARRPRGADPLVIAEALGKLAPHSDEARQALQRMSRRGGEAGERARELWLELERR